MALTINAKHKHHCTHRYTLHSLSYYNNICWKAHKIFFVMDNPWFFIIITILLLALYVWTRCKRQQINNENIQRVVEKVRYQNSIYVHPLNILNIEEYNI